MDKSVFNFNCYVFYNEDGTVTNKNVMLKDMTFFTGSLAFLIFSAILVMAGIAGG